MPNVQELETRIDSEFAAAEGRIKQFQEQQLSQYQGRQERLVEFGKLLDRLRGTIVPRLETLARRFGEKVKVAPSVKPTEREATFSVDSPLARIRLRFSAATDEDVRKLICSSDLEIIPVLMEYDRRDAIEFPLNGVDEAQLGAWFDERILSFVRTYLQLHENQYYLRDEMVEDPVARVRFPKYAAGAKLERDGKMHYFIGEETRQRFEQGAG